MVDIVFDGTVASGLGKGAVFLSISHYREKIREKLGFEPYPGTLNLQINCNKSALLNKIAAVRIEGFEKDGKEYGGASCYKIKICSKGGALIVPDHTEHDENMIELVAPVNLKTELCIEDGDKVKVEFEK